MSTYFVFVLSVAVVLVPPPAEAPSRPSHPITPVSDPNNSWHAPLRAPPLLLTRPDPVDPPLSPFLLVTSLYVGLTFRVWGTKKRRERYPFKFFLLVRHFLVKKMVVQIVSGLHIGHRSSTGLSTVVGRDYTPRPTGPTRWLRVLCGTGFHVVILGECKKTKFVLGPHGWLRKRWK